ncbi:MAG: hypothetical protein KBC84_04325 [Proteobacteria bacterium]|nr:hypothetical protein [Pseudomonadota bacterium]
MLKKISLILIISIFTFINTPEATALVEKLPLSRISRITVGRSSVTCARFTGITKYTPAKRVKGSLYKRIGSTRAKKAACAAISDSTLGNFSLSDLPGADQLIRENTSAARNGITAISGTPPALPDIPAAGVSNTFYRPNVLSNITNNTASNEECSELFNSGTDGQSGGITACYLTQNVGYSFQNILRSGTTLCYMKNAMTNTLLNAGVVARASGSFPNGNIEDLFSTPSGNSSRLVKISFPGEASSIYIKVFGANSNAANGNTYRFQFYSCDGTPSEVSEIEDTAITTDGRYVSTSKSNSEGRLNSSTVTAFLTRVGDELVFDSTRTRTASNNSTSQSNADKFKSYLELDSANVIRNKVYDIVSTNTRRGYSVSKISGTSIASLRFLEGANNERHEDVDFGTHTYTSGIEYRDTLYVSAPSNTYRSELTDVDLDTDEFFSSLPDVNFDTTGFSCSATPNVSITMDITSPAFAGVQSTCEGVRLDGMDFCNSDSDLQNAFNNYNSSCNN